MSDEATIETVTVLTFEELEAVKQAARNAALEEAAGVCETPSREAWDKLWLACEDYFISDKTSVDGMKIAVASLAAAIRALKGPTDERFSIIAPRQAEVAITEAQSISLHNALITSFDEFIAPPARDQGYNEGIEAAARYIQDQYPHDKRVLVPAIRKLKGPKE